MVKREKEEELVFRGQQYARAVGLYQRKYANAFPPSLDVLIEQRFLRRKYTDPMTKGQEGGEGEFQVLYQSSVPQRPIGTAGRPGAGTSRTGTSGIGGGATNLEAAVSGTRQETASSGLQAGELGRTGLGGQPVGPRGGIVGVASRSKEKSLRVYNGRTTYSEWQFIWSPTNTPAGAARPGQRPGQGVGTRPGGPGSPAVRPPSSGNPRD